MDLNGVLMHVYKTLNWHSVIILYPNNLNNPDEHSYGDCLFIMYFGEIVLLGVFGNKLETEKVEKIR